MMSEEHFPTFPDDPIRHTPIGNLWMDSPVDWREIPAAEWEKAARVLEDLMLLADHTTVALTVAMGDALGRAREEARRAAEREATPEAERNSFGLSPEEDKRLLGLLRRSDAVNNAYTFVLDHAPEEAYTRASTLEWLEVLSEEMHDEFNRYRYELGLAGPGQPE